jgi:hypothetical protein
MFVVGIVGTMGADDNQHSMHWLLVVVRRQRAHGAGRKDEERRGNAGGVRWPDAEERRKREAAVHGLPARLL